MKGESLALFRRYWANPSYGLPDAPGVFGRARFGDVDLFLLDDRWYRTANELLDEPGKTMFGAAAARVAAQRARLFARAAQARRQRQRRCGTARTASRASITTRTSRSRSRDWLLAQRVDGVMFATGDRHFTELLRVERPGAYPLYEFTSSPLTSRPWENPDQAERDESRRRAGHARRQAPVRPDPRHRSGERAPHRARELRPDRRAAVAAGIARAGSALPAPVNVAPAAAVSPCSARRSSAACVIGVAASLVFAQAQSARPVRAGDARPSGCPEQRRR